MANQALSQQDQEELLRAFQRVEAEEMGRGTHDTFLGIADRLAERYGVPRASAAAPACGHGSRPCGH
ncbi:MAG: hypothetical protein ABSG86_08815 [Thermoguttaceae bacterium]|jgi:hemerythrin-like domain-containing protein